MPSKPCDLTNYGDVEDIVATIRDVVVRERAKSEERRSGFLEMTSGIETMLRHEPTINAMRFLSGRTWWGKKPIHEPIRVTSGWVRWAAPNYYEIRIDYGRRNEYDFMGGFITIECDPESGSCKVYGSRNQSEAPYPSKMQRPERFQWCGVLAPDTTSIKEVMEAIARELSLFCA